MPNEPKDCGEIVMKNQHVIACVGYYSVVFSKILQERYELRQELVHFQTKTNYVVVDETLIFLHR